MDHGLFKFKHFWQCLHRKGIVHRWMSEKVCPEGFFLNLTNKHLPYSIGLVKQIPYLHKLITKICNLLRNNYTNTYFGIHLLINDIIVRLPPQSISHCLWSSYDMFSHRFRRSSHSLSLTHFKLMVKAFRNHSTTSVGFMGLKVHKKHFKI